MTSILPRYTLPLLLASGLLLRIIIAWAPLEWLLKYVLSDDTFYYLTIARNASEGFGFTFDRLAATNGFHPLWMVVLLPVYFICNDRTVAIHVVLTISALADIYSLYFLNNLLKGTRDFARICTLVIFCFSPILFSYAGPLNGMETPLNTLLIILYLTAYKKILIANVLTVREAMVLGSLSGFLFLVRTDNIILLALTYAHLAVAQKPRWTLLRHLTLAGSIGSILALPWFIWSWQKFQTIVQVSGLSLGVAIKAILNEGGRVWTDDVVQFIGNLANTVTFFPVFLYDTRILSFPSGVVIVLLVALAGAAFKSFHHQGKEHQMVLRDARWIVIPLLAAIMFVLAHTIRAVYMRGWYYASLGPIAFVTLAFLIDMWIAGSGNRQRRKAFVLLGGVLLLAFSSASLLKRHQGETGKMAMVETMNRILPEGSRVGSWNAGVYGYFFEKGEIVGLDGLVNNDVYPHIINRSVGSYCREVNIMYLVDPAGSLAFAERFWGNGPGGIMNSLQVIDSVHGGNEHEPILLGRLKY